MIRSVPLLLVLLLHSVLSAQTLDVDLGIDLDNPAFREEFYGSFETGLLAGAPAMSPRESVFISVITATYQQDIDAAIDFALEEIRREERRVANSQRYERSLEMDYVYSANAEYAIGQLYQLKGNARLAEQYYLQAIEKYPAYVSAYIRLMEMYLEAEDCPTAMEAGRKAVEIGGPNGFVFRSIGLCHFLDTNYNTALTAFRTAYTFNPEEDTNAYYYAVSALNSGAYAEAISILSELVQKYPDRVSYHSLLVNAYLESANVEGALQTLEILRRKGMMSSESYSLLGNIYINKSMPEAALTAYQENLDQFAASVGFAQFEQQFRNLLRFDDWQLMASFLASGEEVYSAGINATQQQTMRVMRAQVQIGQGELQQGGEELLLVIENDPTNGEALLSLARLYRQQQDFERAAIFYQRAASEETVMLTALMEAAQLATDREQWQNAIDLLQSALEVAPTESAGVITQNLSALQRVQALRNQ